MSEPIVEEEKVEGQWIRLASSQHKCTARPTHELPGQTVQANDLWSCASCDRVHNVNDVQRDGLDVGEYPRILWAQPL